MDARDSHMQEEAWRAQKFVRASINSCIAAAQHPEAPESLQAAYLDFSRRTAQITYLYTSAQKEPLFGDVLADLAAIVRETRVREITIIWNGANLLQPLVQCVARYHQNSIVDGVLLPVLD